MPTESWDEPNLNSTARIMLRQEAVRAAFNAYVEWWRSAGDLDDAEPDVPSFIDDSYYRGELKRAARQFLNVLRAAEHG